MDALSGSPLNPLHYRLTQHKSYLSIHKYPSVHKLFDAVFIFKMIKISQHSIWLITIFQGNDLSWCDDKCPKFGQINSNSSENLETPCTMLRTDIGK